MRRMPCAFWARSPRNAIPPEVEPAEAYYQQALALAEELGMRPFQTHCHRGLGTLYAKLGQPEQAHVKLSAAIVLYRAMDMTLWLPEVEEALVQRITLATEHRFACYLATEMAQEGWIFVAQGRVEEGLATMRGDSRSSATQAQEVSYRMQVF